MSIAYPMILCYCYDKVLCLCLIMFVFYFRIHSSPYSFSKRQNEYKSNICLTYTISNKKSIMINQVKMPIYLIQGLHNKQIKLMLSKSMGDAQSQQHTTSAHHNSQNASICLQIAIQSILKRKLCQSMNNLLLNDIRKAYSQRQKKIRSINNQNQSLKKLVQSTNVTNLQLSKTIQQLQSQLFSIHQQFALIKQKPQPQPQPSAQLTTQDSIAAQLQRKTSQLHSLQQKTTLLQAQLTQTKDRFQHYHSLLKTTRAQRDNMKLLVQQKQQQLQFYKEKDQRNMQQQRMSQQKMIEMRHSYETTQIQIRKIEVEVERLLNQKEKCSAQIKAKEEQFGLQMAQKEHHIQEMEIVAFKREKELMEIGFQREMAQKALELQQKTRENEIRMKEEQIRQQQNTINRLLFLHQQASAQSIRTKAQIGQIITQNNKIKAQYTQLHIQYDCLSQQHAKVVQLRQAQQKIAEIPPIVVQDLQKLQLRRQLQLLNTQMAQNIRNGQRQKRQLRQSIQKITIQMHMNISIHSQQKKILRQQVQRSRNQQYQISQQKIKRQKQDIQALRQQTQRLTSIIDNNQKSYKLLQKQQKQSLQHNQQMIQLTAHLQQQLVSSNQQKDHLNNKLKPLQMKLMEFEEKLQQAMMDRSVSQNQGIMASQSRISVLEETIGHNTQEKRRLLQRNSAQNLEIIALQAQINRLNTQQTYKQTKILKKVGGQYGQLEEQVSNQSRKVQGQNHVSSKYSAYLQQQLKKKQQQIQRMTDNQAELLNQTQTYILQINQLQKDKKQQIEGRRQQQALIQRMHRQYKTQQHQHQQQLKSIHNKVIKLKESIAQKDQQLNDLRSNQKILQNELFAMQQQKNNALKTNTRLKGQLQEITKENALLTQQNQITLIENKHINARITRITKDYEDLQKINRQWQREKAVKIQKTSQQKDSQLQTHVQFYKQKNIVQIKEQQLLWSRMRLNNKQQQLSKLRQQNIQIQSEMGKLRQRSHRLQHWQIRCDRQAGAHLQTRLKLKEIQSTNNTLLEQLRSKQQQLRNRQQQYDMQLKQYGQTFQKLRKQMDKEKGNEWQQIDRSGQFQRRNRQGQVLKQIALQLDSNFTIQQQQQQMQLRILLKISQEISQLMAGNQLLHQKCQELQQTLYSDKNQMCSQQILLMFHKTIAEYILFIRTQALLPPQQVPRQPLFSWSTGVEKYLEEVGRFLRSVVIVAQNQAIHNRVDHQHYTYRPRISKDQDHSRTIMRQQSIKTQQKPSNQPPLATNTQKTSIQSKFGMSSKVKAAASSQMRIFTHSSSYNGLTQLQANSQKGGNIWMPMIQSRQIRRRDHQ